MPRWCFDMPPPVTPRDVHEWIKEFLRQRPDIGLGGAISNMILAPSNPFDTTARRTPRAGVVLGMILFGVSLGCFYYFNFAR